jgi:Raf kinase inhibitor-like YbhB/YbcL family protein
MRSTVAVALLIVSLPLSNGVAAMSFTLKSSAFQPGANIPQKYTCRGADVSPPLAWKGAPSGTKAFALIVDDPDAPAGDWVHWVAANIPATTPELPEGVPAGENLPGGGVQGDNDFRKLGYGGPCPPPGKPHRYFFRLYALDAPLDVKPGVAKRALEDAMKGHVLGQAELMGKFARG